jgi:hypothetical protein
MSAYFNKVPAFFTVLLNQFRSLGQFADVEPFDYPFAASDIAQLHRIARDPVVASVDAQTWNGLLLDPYFANLAGEVSIFSKQVLHQRLADGLGDAPRAALTQRLRALMREPPALEEMVRACRSLRRADTEIAALLFEETLPAVPKWAGYTWPLFAGMLASIAAVALTALAWLGAAACLYQLIVLQMRYHEQIARWDRAMESLQMLLRASSLLGQLRHPLLDQFAGAATMAGKLNRRLGRSPALAMIPGLRGYTDWFLLANVNHYLKGIGIVGTQRDFLRACFLRCADLEADLALARHLLDTETTCWAEASADGAIIIEQAVHPLLEHAAPLSIVLPGKGAFISGQNGIGKSTLLRTVGLNLLVARAFGFCYARKATVSMLPVYASMQSEDSLLGGESLYIAELQRARELLAAAAGPQCGTFIIDEIFRGTNHMESVSAAAAVIDELAATGMVVVSSHNLILASLLEHRLAPFCVARDDRRMLVLAPGVLARTNGIALLAQRGFGASIEANAAAVFDWLSAYLAHPRSGSHVLGAKACGRHDIEQGSMN